MNESSGMARFAPLAGVVFVVILIIASVFVGATDFLPEESRAIEILSNQSLWLGGYLGSLSGFFLAWFSGSLRAALLRHEGSGRLAELAFGGGLGAGLLVLVAFTLLGTGSERVTMAGGISGPQALMIYDTYGALLGFPVPMALAVMVGATAGVSLQTGVFPAWFGWLSVVLTVALLSPVAYIAIMLGLVWVVVVSIWLFVRGGQSPVMG